MNINRDYTTVNPDNTGARGRKGVKSDYRWIVIHYVGNADANGFETTAKNNCIYYRDAKVGASANYYVDSTGVYQSVPWDSDRYAWHCGVGIGNENKYQYLLNDGVSQCNNATALGVEICVCKLSVKTKNVGDTDWYFNEATYDHAVEFVRYLMDFFDIDISHVVRHQDVNSIHKRCPRPFTSDDVNVYYKKTGNTLWKEFKEKLAAVDTPPKQPEAPTASILYRVRKSWADAASQLGAFSSLKNAEALADKNAGYYVFDDTGRMLYPEVSTAAVCQAYQVNAPDGLNLRSTPNSSDSGNIVKILGENTYVLALKEQEDGWVYVKYTGDNRVYEGWVYKPFLSISAGLYGKMVSSPDGTLNIRTKPGIKGSVIAVMGNGFGFTVLEPVPGTNWGLIWCGETIGYCDISNAYSYRV